MTSSDWTLSLCKHRDFRWKWRLMRNGAVVVAGQTMTKLGARRQARKLKRDILFNEQKHLRSFTERI